VTAGAAGVALGTLTGDSSSDSDRPEDTGVSCAGVPASFASGDCVARPETRLGSLRTDDFTGGFGAWPATNRV